MKQRLRAPVTFAPAVVLVMLAWAFAAVHAGRNAGDLASVDPGSAGDASLSAADPVSEPMIIPHVLPLEGPWVVAVQPGHWEVDQLPAEHARRRGNVGAAHRGVREIDVNLAVTRALVPMLEAEGWMVMIVPATVTPGLRADAFISIHADWAANPNRSGWKLAAPWRPSPAARSLALALRSSFLAEQNLNEDYGGITVGMRGYFGFASHRFHHASSPYTPAVLVELGFLTNDVERTRLAERPEYYAAIIHRGLVDYFADRDRYDTESLVPREFGPMVVGAGGASVRRSAEAVSSVLRHLEPDEAVRPVDAIDGWYEIRIRTPALTGWVKAVELVPYGAPARDEAPLLVDDVPGSR